MFHRIYDDVIYNAYQCRRCKKFSFRNSVESEECEPRPVVYVLPTNGKWSTTELLCIDCNKDLHKFMTEYEYY